MTTIDILDLKGSSTDKIDIPEEITSLEVNTNILHMEVKRFLASSRSGTSKAKGRSEVSGGGRKPWRQKGTGNARAGSNRSPLWRHGGVTFGPVPRDYSFKLNKKVVRKSKLMALVDKINDSRLLIVSGFNFDKPSTKEAYNVLKSLKINENKVLVVIDDLEGSEVLSFRNLPNVLLTSYKSINTYELLVSDFVLFTKSSFEKMLKELSNARS
ncbi:MAG TPA: 50S ribosomal protein L4 [Actinobacteria bacterium]|jgi:large subunit ribosomal protein L4|nr:50S ribosomal protein L4 [Actinomycetota bacterium]